MKAAINCEDNEIHINAISKLNVNTQNELDNLFLRSQPIVNEDQSGVSLINSERSEFNKPLNNKKDRLLKKISELEEENSLLQNDVKSLKEEREESQKKIDILIGDMKNKGEEIELITKPVIFNKVV